MQSCYYEIHEVADFFIFLLLSDVICQHLYSLVLLLFIIYCCVQVLDRTFMTSLKKSLEEIQQEVMTSFTNFKNCSNILQAVLSQFIVTGFKKSLSLTNRLSNIHHV